MWTYPPWQGWCLPRGLSPRERLSAYATWCNAVEGNTTFYATPALDTVRSWAEQTSPDFRFVLKLPKPITHERRRAGGVDEEAARAPPVTGSHRLSDRPPHRPGRHGPHAGWRPWLDAVAGWLREGRSPTVFIHTPDNVDALELARRFHDDVRARVPEVEPLPEPIPAGPPTLF
jgi:uncharacterized protein YecE (DUF72 family)